MTPFRFKTIHHGGALKPEGTSIHVNRVAEHEKLTGQVQGKKATSLEERFANALDKHNVTYVFQAVIDPGMLPTTVRRNLPGELQIDFLLMSGGLPVQPIQIDGEIGHYKRDWQKVVDAIKDAGVNDVLSRAFGSKPVIRVPFNEIATPEMTDLKVREIALVTGSYLLPAGAGQVPAPKPVVQHSNKQPSSYTNKKQNIQQAPTPTKTGGATAI